MTDADKKSQNRRKLSTIEESIRALIDKESDGLVEAKADIEIREARITALEDALREVTKKPAAESE